MAGVDSIYTLYNEGSGNADLDRIEYDGSGNQTVYAGGSGNQPVSLAAAPNGYADILWTSTSGLATIWSIRSNNAHTQLTFGPISGWTAKSIAVGPDTLLHVAWTYGPDPELSLFTVQSNGTYSSENYTPPSGATFQQIAVGPDDLLRVFWTNTSSGAAYIWTVQSNGTYTSETYGPFADLTPLQMAIGSDDLVQILWANTSTNAATLLTINSSSSYNTESFGPFTGYGAGTTMTATGLSTNTDGDTNIYWQQSGSAWGDTDELGYYVPTVTPTGAYSSTEEFSFGYPATSFVGIAGATSGAFGPIPPP